MNITTTNIKIVKIATTNITNVKWQLNDEQKHESGEEHIKKKQPKIAAGIWKM